MKFYTTSEYANYAHVHMYLVGKAFLSSARQSGFSDDQYSFRVSIGDNVVTWELNTAEKDIVRLFDRAKEARYDGEAIKQAVAEVAEKMGCSFEIANMKTLSNELRNISFRHEKPRHTNDSLDSPALRFIAKS